MKAGWGFRRLGDVCTVNKRKHDGSAKPYVGMEDIESGTGRHLGAKTTLTVKSLTFGFTPEQVLYGRLRPYLNKVLLPDFEGHCSTEIFPLQPTPALDKGFLYHWIKQETVVAAIDATCTGARMPRADVNDILKFEIPLPPLEEQRRIVAVLDKAFAGIATATANAKQNFANARALFPSILADALHEVAGDWGSCELQSLLASGRKISYGIVKPGRHDPDGVRLIKSQQVRDDSMDLSADFRITRALDNEYARTRLQGGEILLNLVGASIGRSAIAPDDLRGANVSRAIAVIPVRADLVPWVQYNLRGSLGQELIRSKTGGSAQPVLNLAEVKALPIPLPPLGKQDTIIQRLDKLSSETQLLAQIYRDKIAALAEFKQSLLNLAFSGDLTERKPLVA